MSEKCVLIWMLKASDVVTVTSSWRECMHATVVKERPQLGCTYLGWHDFSATGSKQVFSTARTAKPRSQLKHVWKEMSNYSVIKGRADVCICSLSKEADIERLLTKDTGDGEMWHLGAFTCHAALASFWWVTENLLKYSNEQKSQELLLFHSA